MNRIDKKFKKLKREKKKAFIVYITAGDPDLKTTGRLALELDRRGVDILELGVPFSDPIADGPTIQAASQRALAGGVNLKKIFRLVRMIRKRSDIPIALMTYYNPVHAYDVGSFVREADDSGVDGVIIPDLPPEEARRLITSSKRHNFKDIFLLSPTSSRERMVLVSKRSGGFIYYVSLTGVTGVRRELAKDIAAGVKQIKRLTKKPVCVGFGVSNPAQARSIARIADGVIVGSAVIKIIERNLGKTGLVKEVGRFVRGLVKAVKQ